MPCAGALDFFAAYKSLSKPPFSLKHHVNSLFDNGAEFDRLWLVSAATSPTKSIEASKTENIERTLGP